MSPQIEDFVMGVIPATILLIIVVIVVILLQLTPDSYSVPASLSDAIAACGEKNGTAIGVDRFVACLVDKGYGFTLNGDAVRIEPK